MRRENRAWFKAKIFFLERIGNPSVINLSKESKDGKKDSEGNKMESVKLSIVVTVKRHFKHPPF